MSGHFNRLTPAEAERLALLIEECGEVILAAGKVLRHGYESYNPLIDGTPPTNRADLAKELGHLRHAMLLLTYHHDVNGTDVARSAAQKGATISRWLHHQPKTEEDIS